MFHPQDSGGGQSNGRIGAGLWYSDAFTAKILSPVADTLLYLRGPGADLLVVVCFEYQTSSVNLQRRTQPQHSRHGAALRAANATGAFQTDNQLKPLLISLMTRWSNT